MPVRPISRDQMWLLPPSLDELISPEHPARFVAEFVDALDRSDWCELGVELDGGALGAPSYHPRGLLSVWLYGFMTGVRSCRKLEMACRDQLPYLWLTGRQYPDHNTLWRFYKSHRESMRRLFERTVRMAVRMNMVDLALQAVDGTKVGANASRERTYDEQGLRRLLKRLEGVVKELESQNEAGEDVASAQLPQELTNTDALREQVREAMEELSDQEDKDRINLTDKDARLMKTPGGFISGYNAQAMVSAVDGDDDRGGMLITAAEVVEDEDDHGQLVPMVEQSEEVSGSRSELTLADAGYHSGSNVEALLGRGQKVVMPETQRRALRGQYHKDRFIYDARTDSYMCPQGEVLPFRRSKLTRDVPMRVYRASGAVCRGCPAFGVCTIDSRHGRALEIGPHEAALRSHRMWMSTDEAKAVYKRRKQLVEPVFGILKEQQGARRFLLRGLANVKAEWVMLTTAFNLRTLWRIWRDRSPGQGWYRLSSNLSVHRRIRSTSMLRHKSASVQPLS